MKLSPRGPLNFGSEGDAGGGGHSTFFCGCVPHGFPKVRSKEQIFLEKFESSELKFCPKQGLKCKKFQKIENGGT